MKKKKEQKCAVQCCSKAVTPGKGQKWKKMFGSPLAPSPRRRHSHHLKRRAREERGEMGGRGGRQRSNHCTQLQNSNTSQPGVEKKKEKKTETKVEGEKGNVQLTKVARASYIKHLLPLPVLVIAHDCKQVSDKNLKKDESNRASFKDHQSRPSKLRYY